MSEFEYPLARITKSCAIKNGNNLLIYVEGLTSGYDGQLLVKRGSNLAHPPEFIVYEIPGNRGFNPVAAPTGMLTVDAYVFTNDVVPETIILKSDSKREEVRIEEAKTAT